MSAAGVLPHGSKAPPSNEHSSVPPASSAENAIEADVWLDGVVAGLTRVTVGASGATASTVQATVVALPILPPASTCRTAYVWAPLVSAERFAGLAPHET